MAQSDLMLEMYITAYNASKNPTHLWSIYQHYRECNRPIPDSILEYFDGVAQGLTPEDGLFRKPYVPDDSDIFVRRVVLGRHTTHDANTDLKGVIATALKAKKVTNEKAGEMFGVSSKSIQRWRKKVR